MSNAQVTKVNPATPQKAPTLWGIHAGRTGDADKLFLKHNVIGLGERSQFIEAISHEPHGL